MTGEVNEPRPHSGHSLIPARRDELGVIVVCACAGWGYAGSTDATARLAFDQHLKEDIDGGGVRRTP